MTNTTTRFLVQLFALLLCLPFAGCTVQGDMVHTEEIAHTQTPGLSTIYFDKFIRKLNQLPPPSQGRPGAPVLQLNHRFEKNEVFASGRSRGIGVQLSGLIHLEQPGIYQFKAMANDGIALRIDDQLIFTDPTVHGDRFSPTGTFTATKDDWYPILIRYFQRKGTATLILYWQQPGDSSFEVIPAAAYAH